MIESLKLWWRAHSAGERGLMAVLGAALLLVFLWLGVWQPVTSGLATGWARQGAALDRHASVADKVAALKRMPAASAPIGPHQPIDQLVGQSAAEAGFTLDRTGLQGAGRVSIHIAAARMGPLLDWLSRLEAAGIGVQTISIVPGETDGTVTVQAVLQEMAP